MAMTAKVKDELSRHVVTKPCCRKAEVAATLRFAGGLHIIGGRIVVEAELDTANAARRLRRELSEVYGHTPEVLVLAAGGLRKGSRYVVRVVNDGESLARQTGLIDGRGRPVRGLPPKVVSGSVCDAEAAWRGAFLAHGSLTEPGRSSAMEVTCPGPEAALALVGAARRLGISAKAREVRGVDRVVIRDGDAIGAMLTRLGAHDAVLAWEERRIRRDPLGQPRHQRGGGAPGQRLCDEIMPVARCGQRDEEIARQERAGVDRHAGRAPVARGDAARRGLRLGPGPENRHRLSPRRPRRNRHVHAPKPSSAATAMLACSMSSKGNTSWPITWPVS